MLACLGGGSLLFGWWRVGVLQGEGRGRGEGVLGVSAGLAGG